MTDDLISRAAAVAALHKVARKDPMPTIGRVEAALAALPATQPAQGETVAWQWRSRVKGGAWDSWENGRFDGPVPSWLQVEERQLPTPPDTSGADLDALVAELRADAKLHEDLLPDRAADAITALSAKLGAVMAQYHTLRTRNGCTDMTPDPDGEWVRREDYEAERKNADALYAALRSARDLITLKMCSINPAREHALDTYTACRKGKE